MVLNGKVEDFPDWLTKYMELMHIMRLFCTVIGKEYLPEAEPILPESPNDDQQAAYDTKMQERPEQS